MHHLLVGIIVYAVLVSIALTVGYAAVAPMVDLIPPGRLRLTLGLWLGLFLMAPLAWAPLNSYLDGRADTYWHELGHEWPVYTMFLSGFLVSRVRHGRKRLR